MKRLLLVLALLSVILSGIALAQQVTITVFGGSGSHNYPTSGTSQYTMGGTNLLRTDNNLFTQPTLISEFNITIDNINKNNCENASGSWMCGSPGTQYFLCLQFDNEGIIASQCKPYLTVTGTAGQPWTISASINTNLNYQITPAKSVQTVSYLLQNPTSGGRPGFRIRTVNWDGGISGSITKPLNFFRKKDSSVNLGVVSSLVSLQGYIGDLKVTSSDPKVFPYFGGSVTDDPTKGSYDAQTETYNPISPSLVLACLNTFQEYTAVGDPVCDYMNEQICAARIPPSDWYNGVCCGDANVNPNAESPPSDCKYYGTVAGLGNRVMNAICGKSGTNWVWAGQLDPGVITDFTSCGAMTQVVATGTQFITCGNTQNTAGITVNQLQGTTDIAGHTYWCEGPQLRECGGSSSYSPTQYTKTTGTRIDINSEAYYCKSTGALSKTLDGDEQGCTAAGFSWTGTKCCGEPDDLLKNYDDPSGQGVCVNNQVLAQGSVTGIEQDILIHNGAYYFCNEQRTLGYTGTTTIADFPGVQINEKGFCGLPLLNVKSTGADKNAICTPQGIWQYVEFTQTSIVEQTGWIPTTTQTQTGCCPTNMCWDGNQCRASGHFVSLGGKGYKCP